MNKVNKRYITAIKEELNISPTLKAVDISSCAQPAIKKDKVSQHETAPHQRYFTWINLCITPGGAPGVNCVQSYPMPPPPD
jgi:hypothetical protein